MASTEKINIKLIEKLNEFYKAWAENDKMQDFEIYVRVPDLEGGTLGNTIFEFIKNKRIAMYRTPSIRHTETIYAKDKGVITIHKVLPDAFFIENEDDNQ